MRLGLAGFVATAVAFGPASTAYGLFLPDLRVEFGLSTEAAGVVGSALQAGYLLSLLTTGLLVGSLGPRILTVVGGLFAALGMALVALSPGSGALACGVVLAGVSAGLSWSPYSDVVEASVPGDLKGRVLSVVSTGATLGIVVTGVVALLAAAWGLPWRAAWLTFAAAGAISAVVNLLLMGGLPRADPSAPRPENRAQEGPLARGGCCSAPVRRPCSPCRSPSGRSSPSTGLSPPTSWSPAPVARRPSRDRSSTLPWVLRVSRASLPGSWSSASGYTLRCERSFCA